MSSPAFLEAVSRSGPSLAVTLTDVVGEMADGALLDAPVQVEQLVEIDRDALAEALAALGST